jgi:hypothetical protein
VIERLELLAWLNAKTFGQMIERVDSYADLLGDGALKVTTDGDSVITLATTSTAMMLPPLPAALA